MNSPWSGTAFGRTVTIACAWMIVLPASFAQAPAQTVVEMPDTQQAAPLLSPDQLSNLVSPVALYPDPLLSQVLAASTYPLEIVQAQQWLSQNKGLQGSQLMDAARGQNWDPSVQALVAFPDALALLANDIRWTSDLGNAFLAQQADVMSAVQLMRARARDNGRLATTPQQVVRVEYQDGRDAIQIEPADPQVIYVPIYQPAYVWGAPVYGAYPDLWYPPGYGWGYGFGSGLYMNSYFPSWGGWGGWGWNCGWWGGGLSVNFNFFNRYGYRGGYYGRDGGYSGYSGGRNAWMHDSDHRMGVPYSNHNVASRYGGNYGRMGGSQYSSGGRTGGGQWNGGRSDSGRSGNWQSTGGGARVQGNGSRSGNSGAWQRFGESNRPQSTGGSNARGFAGSNQSGARWSTRGDAGSSRQSSPNGAYGGNSRSYQEPNQSGRAYGSSQGYSNQSPSNRSYSTGSSSGRGSRTSDSRSYSTPSPSYSAPRSFAGSGGGSRSSESRSYSAPSQSNSAPRSYSGSGGFGGARSSESRSFSSPSRSFSAPQSSSSPRSSGGGSGFSGGGSSGSSGFSGGRSGGSSGASGGHSGGGGGGGGHRR